MNSPASCMRCGRPVRRDVAGGACPACVLRGALPAAEGLEELLRGDRAVVRQQFGPYELLEEIGRGGMGVIYKARHTTLDRLVAVKMLLAGEFADVPSRDRLLREARVAAGLRHPGIVTIHDVGHHEGRPYFAMEYVPGSNLAQRCRDALPPVATVARWVQHLARAVHEAHLQGVIHRDLKPANVLIGPDDLPKLTDFGLTKSLTDPGQTLGSAGSPNFMAPEQADTSLGPTGVATDVFGLGAIFYYLLTGRPPNAGETLGETVQAAIRCTPVAPRQLRPGLSPDLETVALKCLERDPSRRYPSALEVAEELARWGRGEPLLARPPGIGERMAKWVRRQPLLAGLAGTIAICVVAGLATTTWQAAKALRAADRARAAELAARRVAYAADMAIASAAAGAGDYGAVRDILERTRPGPGQPDLRGWEWRYLWQNSQTAAEAIFGGRAHRIASMALFPDGHTVALGEQQGGFSLWDAISGRRLFETAGPLNQVRHPSLAGGAPVICRLAMVPGTPWLAYTDCRSPSNSFIHLWDTRAHTNIRSISISGIPRHLAVSPDGQRIACSLMHPDERVLVLEVGTGALMRSIPSHFSAWSKGNTLAFTTDGRGLSVEDVQNRSMRIVEVETGRDLHRFPLDQTFPIAVAFSPDGRWLATHAGFDDPRVIQIWNLDTGQLHTTVPASALSLAFDPAGTRLAAGLRIYRVPEFKLERQYYGESDVSLPALFLPDGNTFLNEDGTGSVSRWRLDTPALHRGGRPFPMTAIALCPPRQSFLVVDTNGTVLEWKPPLPEPAVVPGLGTNTFRIGVAPERRQIITVRTDGNVHLHSMDTWQETASFLPDTVPATAVLWVGNPGLLGLRTRAEQLQFWNLDSLKPVWKVPLLAGRELTPATPAGRLYQVGADGFVQEYDAVERRVTVHPIDIFGMHRVSVSPDGRCILLTEPDGAVRMVDTRDWKSAGAFEAYRRPVQHGTAFWPEESRIAFAGTDVVDIRTGRPLLHLAADFQFAGSVLVSQDGSTLIATSATTPRGFLWWAPSWAEIERRMESIHPGSGR